MWIVSIKRPHENVYIMPPVPDTVEAGYAIAPTRDGFPVDNAGPQAQTTKGLDNEREPVRQIITRPAIEPNPLAVLPGDYPESIMLDLYQPFRPGRRTRGTGWKARRYEPRRQGTRTQTRHARAK
jgi:hypothetical protein